MATETMSTETPQPTEKASRWEDFIDIFFSPTELFQRRANDSWWVPLLVVSALSLVLYYAFLPVQTAFGQAQRAERLAANPEAQAQMQSMGNTFTMIGGIFVPIMMAIILAIGAVITWGAAKLSGIDLSMKRSLMINAFLGMLVVVQQIVITVLAFLKVNRGEALHPLKDRSTGVIRLLDLEQMPDLAVAFLSRIDVLAFWILVWTAIALVAVTGAPKGRAYAAATVIWIVGVLPALLGVIFTS
jgi:hypothetical protein